MFKQHLVPIAWLMSVVVVALALIAWGVCLPVSFDKLRVYDIFPLFGILAFSLMWTHYIVGALRLSSGFERKKLNLFYNATAAVVLVALLLHPGLITWQAWRDQIGLPLQYVAPDLQLYVVLGVVAWLVFLLFEFKEAYGQRKWWHFIERANELAMVAILIHGFFLGRTCLPDWFMAIWVFYGITFAIAAIYDARVRHRQTGSWL